jgi:penicillin G amidase
MRNIIGFVFNAIVGLSLLLFFNGNIKVEKLPLPALGKFLDPVKGIWNNARHSYKDLALSTDQINSESSIIFDERYIPHIYAQTTEDALFLQGYVEAYTRLFQMDFLARAASSRLAEVLGPTALPIDIDRRKKGTEHAANVAVLEWKNHPKEFALLQKYIDGVNHYISNLKPKDYPIEYKLLGFKPEPWDMNKAAYTFKYMSDVLSYGSNDLSNTNLRGLLGQELFESLYLNPDTKSFPIIPSEVTYKKDSTEKTTTDSIIIPPIPNINYEKHIPGIGSNNWAINGSKSKTGNPILCGDPHLMLGLPSVWIELQITTNDFNAYGVSIPGMPGIMIGFNEHMAWTETNVGMDLEDLYLMKWEDSTRKKYYVDGVLKEAQLDVKEIKVKGKPSVYDTAYITDFGYVAKLSSDAKSDIASNWTAASVVKRPDFISFVLLMQAKNVNEFNSHLQLFSNPPQNFLFASKEGDIGIRVNGDFPARGDGDGLYVEDGSKSSNLWENLIPFDELPYIINPKSGYITSSNQISTAENYPYFYSMRHPDHHRNRVINDLLANKENFSVKEMKQMHGNKTSYMARDFVQSIVKFKDNQNSGVLEILTDWDFHYDKNEIGPAVYSELHGKMSKNTFDEIDSLSKQYHVRYPESHLLIKLLTDQPDHIIFDIKNTPKVETAKDILDLCIQEMVNDENSIYNKKATWAQTRKTNLHHILRLPAFSELDIETDGHPETINAIGTGWGPSWRMVVHLKEDIEAWGVYPGGQMGDPASKFYKNFLPKWLRNEHYKLHFSKKPEDIHKERIVHTITIKRA